MGWWCVCGGGGGGGEGGSLLSLIPSLFLSSLLFLSSVVLSIRSLSLSLLFLSSPLSVRMSMITRPVGSLSLCTQGSDLPECQSAWTLAHSLFAEHVRIMQETTVLV